MDFPTLLYRCPGLHQCDGGSFSTLHVQSDKEAAAALRAGWCESLPEAMGLAPPPSKAPSTKRQGLRNAAGKDTLAPQETQGADEDGLV